MNITTIVPVLPTVICKRKMKTKKVHWGKENKRKVKKT